MFEVKLISGIAQKSIAFEHPLRLRDPKRISEMFLAGDDLPGPAVSRALEIEAGRRFGLQLGVARLIMPPFWGAIAAIEENYRNFGSH